MPLPHAQPDLADLPPPWPPGLSRPPAGLTVHAAATPAAAAQALADQVAQALRLAVHQRGRAMLWVSGGSTPLPFFQALAGMALDWARVQVALVDDRWCDPTNADAQADSNEAMVRRHLLVGPAAAARFTGWWRAGVDDPVAEAGRDPALSLAVSAWVDACPWPADVVVLGMGGDGHTASWFPETPQYAQAIQPDARPRWLFTDAPARPNVPRPRATLSLGAVRDTRLLCIHTTGVARAALLSRVWQGEALPIGALWQQALAPEQAMPPVALHWAP